jgi:hypothetical protein
MSKLSFLLFPFPLQRKCHEINCCKNNFILCKLMFQKKYQSSYYITPTKAVAIIATHNLNRVYDKIPLGLTKPAVCYTITRFTV